MVDEQDLEDIGPTDFYYQGSGGLNEFYINASIELHKNLAIGIKASYLFGKNNMARFITFPDSAYMLNTSVDSYTEVGDIFFEFGVQYNKEIGRKLTLGLGAVYLPKQQIKATNSFLVRNYFGSNSGVGLYRDTVASQLKYEGNITIPDKFGFGVMLRKSNSWMVAADYEFQKWSEFEIFGIADSLQNSMQFSLGGEYLPNPIGIVSYFNRVKYRLGFRYNRSYLYLRDIQINEFGISFGLGLPLPRSYSTVNLGFEIGRRGTTAHGLIQENFFKFTLGVAIRETWFVKRRYN